MTNLFNALEICLQQIENGAELESVLKQFPDLATELRPILVTAIKAQQNQTAEPSVEAFRRGRAKVMQHAAKMPAVEKKQQKTKSSPFPLFSRLAVTFSLVVILFFVSSFGVITASASALPGENLYTVKRGWENVRLALVFNGNARQLLKSEFQQERLSEVNRLILAGRSASIEFAGVFMQVNNLNYISGVQVILPIGTQMPVNGAAVLVSGLTNAQGLVEISTLSILPAGTSVPVGNPIEVINENEETESSNTSENEAVEVSPEIVYYDIQGTLQAISENQLIINGLTVFLNNAQVTGQLCIGQTVQVNGYYEADGRFIVTQIIGASACTGNDNSNQNLNDNDNVNSNSNSNNNSNDNDDVDDNSNGGGNSGSGGGDDEDDSGDDDDEEDDD
jgi:uncharacterized membrane protein YgcG